MCLHSVASPKRLLRVMALLMLPVLAACGSKASTGGSSNRLSPSEFAFLAGYGATAQDQPVRDHAEQILDQRCMQARGFRYYTGGSGASAQNGDSPEDHSYVPGVGPTRTEALAVAERRQTGYHLFAAYAPQSPSSIPINDQYVRSLGATEQARYQRALFGPSTKMKTIHTPTGGTYTYPTSGCVAKGQVQLYGSVDAAQNVLTLPGYLLAKLGQETVADPAVVAKNDDWSRCVSRATGVSFKTPHDIIERLQREYTAQGATQAVRSREIAYAVADTRCQFRTGLAAVYAKVLRRRANQLAGPTRRLLLQTFEVEHQATARAQRTLSSAGAG
jgi:hypothetical protein